jgi:hypothetical protein
VIKGILSRVEVEIGLERLQGFTAMGRFSVQCSSTPELLFQNDTNLLVKPKGRDVNTRTIRKNFHMQI